VQIFAPQLGSFSLMRAAASIGLAMIEQIRTKIFADGANLDGILAFAADPRISGFTTNPTLMRQAGITDYQAFAHQLLEKVTEHPISFEVFADEESEILRQARTIASWADNVYVKIPVTTTTGAPLTEVVRALSHDGVKVNVTAMFTVAQVREITSAVAGGAPSYLSIFAGRIADAGVDPLPIMRESIEVMAAAPLAECIWASPREVLNLVQADSVGCHIITMTHDLLKKIDGLGKDLTQFSLETVQMFFRDADAAGYQL
jgi:transaldolase